MGFAATHLDQRLSAEVLRYNSRDILKMPLKNTADGLLILVIGVIMHQTRVERLVENEAGCLILDQLSSPLAHALASDSLANIWFCSTGNCSA